MRVRLDALPKGGTARRSKPRAAHRVLAAKSADLQGEVGERHQRVATAKSCAVEREAGAA